MFGMQPTQQCAGEFLHELRVRAPSSARTTATRVTVVPKPLLDSLPTDDCRVEVMAGSASMRP